jgi:multimeric flavodoxin WrbA
MKTIVISYSLTGNNDALATSIAAELAAKHIKIKELKPRTNGTIAFDMLFNRTPQVDPIVDKVEDYDSVIFVGPVWMGHIAAPLRASFKQCKERLDKYAFISISGGADGPNPKLASELRKRIGKEPISVINLLIADLLPTDPKPTRNITSAYHLSDKDVKNLTNTIMKTLRKSMTK